MEPGAYSVVSAALLQQRNLETVTNNIANASTVGFKAEVATFELRPKDLPPGVPPRLGGRVVERSEWSSNHVNFSQGALRRTANPLDVALTGEGFFVLDSPEGRRYTRAGSFGVNGQGDLISKEGWRVLGRGGVPIRLPSGTPAGGNIHINEGGGVVAGGQSVGQLEVVRFEKLNQLQKRGRSVFAPLDPQNQGTPVAQPRIVQGYVEESNVIVVKEMVRLIETARMYEAYQKILQSFDQTDDRSVNDLGRIQQT